MLIMSDWNQQQLLINMGHCGEYKIQGLNFEYTVLMNKDSSIILKINCSNYRHSFDILKITKYILFLCFSFKL